MKATKKTLLVLLALSGLGGLAACVGEAEVGPGYYQDGWYDDGPWFCGPRGYIGIDVHPDRGGWHHRR